MVMASRNEVLPIYMTGKLDVTQAASPHSIGYVPARMSGRSQTRRPEIALTKRRAVDFCRVATAICPAVLPPRAR
jgi:hypothetical protein